MRRKRNVLVELDEYMPRCLTRSQCKRALRWAEKREIQSNPFAYAEIGILIYDLREAIHSRRLREELDKKGELDV